MKCVKRISAILLVLVFVFLLSACGSNEPLVGKWSYNMDFDKYAESLKTTILSSIEEDKKLIYEELFKVFDGCTIDLTMEFKDDKTFDLDIDKESLNAAVEKIKEKMKSVVIEAQKKAGMSDKDLEAKGTTIDQLVESLSNSFDVDQMTKGFKASGSYVHDGDKLYLFDGDEKDDSKYLEIELDDNEFKITKIEGDILGFKGVENLLPMTFVKA